MLSTSNAESSVNTTISLTVQCCKYINYINLQTQTTTCSPSLIEKEHVASHKVIGFLARKGIAVCYAS